METHKYSQLTFFFRMVVIAVILATSATPLKADEADPYTEEAKEVEMLGGAITCLNIDVSASKTVDTSCRDFIPPSKLAVGEKYYVDGKERMIGKVEVKRGLQKGSFWQGSKLVIVGCNATEFTTKDNQPYTLLLTERCRRVYRSN